MELLAEFAAWSLLAFSLLLFLTQVAAREGGYWLGQRHRAARGDGEAEGVGLVVGGLLGLLAFVLALTLSFGSTRFDERRHGALAEANAIGTAWLRANAPLERCSSLLMTHALLYVQAGLGGSSRRS